MLHRISSFQSQKLHRISVTLNPLCFVFYENIYFQGVQQPLLARFGRVAQGFDLINFYLANFNFLKLGKNRILAIIKGVKSKLKSIFFSLVKVFKILAKIIIPMGCQR